jgi:micrococcal nuclease
VNECWSGSLTAPPCEVLHNRHPDRIRLSGIDCPEKGQVHGTRAKQVASEFAFGKEITVQTHGHDKYKRTMAQVPLLYLTRGRDTLWDLCEPDC